MKNPDMMKRMGLFDKMGKNIHKEIINIKHILYSEDLQLIVMIFTQINQLNLEFI